MTTNCPLHEKGQKTFEAEGNEDFARAAATLERRLKTFCTPKNVVGKLRIALTRRHLRTRLRRRYHLETDYSLFAKSPC